MVAMARFGFRPSSTPLLRGGRFLAPRPSPCSLPLFSSARRSTSLCSLSAPVPSRRSSVGSFPSGFRLFSSSSPLLHSSPSHSLRDYTDFDRLTGENPDTVREIWLKYHQNRDGCVCSVLDAPVYQKLLSRMERCPMFVLPLPTDKGHSGFTTYFLQSQASNHCALITPLEEYKSSGPMALPVVTLYYYPEFAQTKGIVLMRGEVDSARLPKSNDAQYLVHLMQFYYLGVGGNEHKWKFVERFNHEPSAFDFDKVLEDLRRGGSGPLEDEG